MDLLSRYQHNLTAHGFTDDAVQRGLLEKFQRVGDDLSMGEGFLQGVLRRFVPGFAEVTKGLYLYGGVGIGKTYLMDLFYEALPIKQKRREHFHRFMQQIHAQLKQMQGTADPMEQMAEDLAKDVRVLCFDEMFVNDIGDAMLLGNLFKAMFKRHIVIIATSNCAPDDLYKNGLQRELFLPAIAAIKTHMEVVHVDSEQDYRLRTLEQAARYFYPLGEEADKFMAERFKALAICNISHESSIDIENRPIATIAHSDAVLWCDFYKLCDIPRSQLDYLEIANLYTTVLVSDVPAIAANDLHLIRNFIHMVDVFYDAHVKLILTAATDIPGIYAEGPLAFEFQRTQSRLLEMQAKEYLHSAHLG